MSQFWIDYIRTSREAIALRTSGKAMCAEQGCTESVAPRAGNRVPRYCPDHTPTCGFEQKRKTEESRERRNARKRERRESARVRHAAALERTGVRP